jgi:hypothetical protein
MTAGVARLLEENDAFAEFVCWSLARHGRSDWGDVCPDDWKENDVSLKQGLRILSVYQNGSEKICIITEADRSATTVLFPD